MLPPLDEDKTAARLNVDPVKGSAELQPYLPANAPARPIDRLIALSAVGSAYEAQSRLPEARRTYQAYLALAQSLNNRSHIAKALLLIGYLDASTGDINAAIQKYRQSAAISKGAGDARTWSDSSLLLIQLLLSYGNDEAALRQTYELEKLSRLNKVGLRVGMYLVRAQAHYMLGHYQDALAALDRADAILPVKNGTISLLTSASFRTKIAERLGREAEAERFARQCLRLRATLGMGPREFAECDMVLGKIALRRGDLAAARGHFDDVERTVRQFQGERKAKPTDRPNTPDEVQAALTARDLYQNLVDLAAQAGDTRAQAKYLQIVIEAERTLAAARDASRSALAAAEVDAAGKDLGIALLNARNARQKLEADRRLMLWTGGLGAIMVALFGWFLWYRARQARLRQEQRFLERTRIARDLHDTLLQTMTGAQMSIQAAAMQAEQHGLPMARPLGEVAGELGKAMVSARDAVWQMRSEAIERGDLVGAIREWLDLSQSMRPANITFSAPADEVRFEPSKAEDLFRIVQEAVGNASRHAGATRIAVELACSGRSTTLRIEDDGAGFDVAEATAASNQRLGLKGLRERAERLGGKLDLSSGPAQGTRVELLVPA